MIQRARLILRHLLTALTCIGAIWLAGCMPVMEYGSQVDVTALDKLEARQSSQADVLLALGEPRGKGGAEFVKQKGQPRDIWFYEYSKTDGETIQLMILMVFFLDGVYDGYWWFSSLEEIYCKRDVFGLGELQCPEA
jgi:hypothetical protein